MKIGLFSPYDMFKGGGVQEYVSAIRDELVRRGHKAVIITPQPRKYEGAAPEGTLFVGASRDFKSPFHTVVQVSMSLNTDRLEEIFANEKFDVLHIHEPWIPIVSRQLLTKSNAVNVGTFHARLPDTRVSKTLEKVITPYTRSILKYIDVFTAVSLPASQYLKQLSDIEPRLITNGIDLRKYKPKKGQRFEKPTIFYVGRLEKRKGVKYLLRSFALLQRQMPDVQLLIGGDGPDREKLEDIVQEEEIRNVKFLGYLTDKQKIEHIQKADVFCSPALYGESFGIVLLEAMACGTPTVAGNNPGYSGVLQGYGAIGLVNPKDPAEFAQRLRLFLTVEELRKTWIKWALSYVKQFDYRRIVDQYEDLYIKACEEHKWPAKS